MRRLPLFARNCFLTALLTTALVLTPVSVHPQAPPGEGPAEVAIRFLRSFENKDFQTVRALFAPAALVSSVTYAQNGAPQADQLSAEDWMKIASGELAGIEDFRITILKTSELAFAEGATVSIRFHAEGKVGQAFQIEGIDTYSMVRLDGEWRVLQYSYNERIQSLPAAASREPGI